MTENLTGIWQGLYSYPALLEPVGFTSTILESGSWITGTIHETAQDETGVWVDVLASIEGRREVDLIQFVKAYDGKNGWSHQVNYAGQLSRDGTEIEGRWYLPEWTGKFLMIRPEGVRAQQMAQVFAKLPELTHVR